LRRAKVSPLARAFIGWFGPRGLNSLLLALLVVQDGVPGAEVLLAVVGVVVTISVVAHGATATPFSSLYGRTVERTTLEEERESTAAGLFAGSEGALRISADELARRLEGAHSPLVLDVRTRSQYERDPARIPGSVRVLPDHVQDWAMGYLADHPDGEPHLPPITTYCT
jgi:NhaP-type Na+/H+ or K+/H+ antiporter